MTYSTETTTVLSSWDSIRFRASYEPFSEGDGKVVPTLSKWAKPRDLCVFFPLTGTAQGPAPAVEVHQTPPQPPLPSSQRLVHTHGDSGKGDITDSDPGRGPSSVGLWAGDPLEAFEGPPDGVDVMAQAQPGHDPSLRTGGLLSFRSSSNSNCKMKNESVNTDIC